MASLKLPEIVPSPNTDTERLRNAFQGIGTNEKELILVLGHRNAQQRREIRETYQKLYNESLLDRLQSELSGDFRNAIVLWTCDPPERDAKFARDALKVKRKGIKQLQILVEIACASSPNHLMAVRQAYCSLFDCSLEEDIIASVSQPLTKILVGLVSSFRHDKVTVNLEVAKSEAEKLHEAINNNKLDDDHFVWILSTRNVFQIRETFASYKQLYGKTFEEDIKTCGKGDLTSLLNVVVWCIECPEKHFAKVTDSSH
uniref:Annexin, type V n=1 Tax=Medicago truncatula TaxID=3880 RepID=Q1RUA5_MEDTR|nr:Annexin, type V [Medicago truncatula]